jgi:hypothetical protein
MKDTIVVVCLLVLLASSCMAQVPEWRSTVVVKAGYGDSEDQFCYEGVVENHPPSDQPIPCYYVGDEGIFIVDRYQHNIKVFDLSGDFQRAISLEWEFPHKGVLPVSGLDIEVTGGVIYLLKMLVGHPHGEVTKFSCYTIDLKTGEQAGVIMIHNPTLGTTLEGQEVGNSVRINEDEEGTLTVYDRIRRMSYPLIRNGKVVPDQEQKTGVPGMKFGGMRTQYNSEEGRVELMDDSGRNPTASCKGGMVDVSTKGDFILTSISERKSKHYGFYFSIYDANCTEIGRIARLKSSRKGWPAFQANDVFRFGQDGGLYEIHVGNDSVYVYRWSP